MALFAGAGGGILGGHLLGWRCVCAVERDPYARDVLVARQNDGCLPSFPIWDDVCTFDGLPWRGVVDVVSGGFPCQDISVAGKGAGIAGERSGLWREMARIIGEVRPRFVFVENSPALVRRGLAVVLGDLAAMGFNSRWGVLGAIDAGAPHRRERIWIVADAELRRLSERRGVATAVGDGERSGRVCRDVASSGEVEARAMGDAASERLAQRQGKRSDDAAEQSTAIRTGWWLTEPDVGRVAYGVAARVDRLRCIGNGQVPAVVRLAWEKLI